MWDPMSGEAKPAAEVLRAMDVEPIKLGAKEGLAMINGTQLIASLSAQRGGRCDAARFAYMAHETTSLLTYTRYLFFVFKTNFCGCFVDFLASGPPPKPLSSNQSSTIVPSSNTWTGEQHILVD